VAFRLPSGTPSVAFRLPSGTPSVAFRLPSGTPSVAFRQGRNATEGVPYSAPYRT
jgi:hypothetical protein